jgi:hypothetical protein
VSLGAVLVGIGEIEDPEEAGQELPVDEAPDGAPGNRRGAPSGPTGRPPMGEVQLPGCREERNPAAASRSRRPRFILERYRFSGSTFAASGEAEAGLLAVDAREHDPPVQALQRHNRPP